MSISTFVIIPPKKEIVKIRKTEADSDIDGGENTLAQDCKNFNITFLLHAIYPQLLRR